ncbi:MAG: SDR family NAD(P)-dependent oxidoreductase, partial [Nitrososphaerales archaeon]
MTQRQLDGKVAIITGAGSGIGRATAMLFASEGARVVIADISEEGGKKTQEMIAEKFGQERSRFVKTNVGSETDIREMFDTALAAFGKLDVMFNNAGIYEWTSVEKTPTETWDHIIA